MLNSLIWHSRLLVPDSISPLSSEELASGKLPSEVAMHFLRFWLCSISLLYLMATILQIFLSTSPRSASLSRLRPTVLKLGVPPNASGLLCSPPLWVPNKYSFICLHITLVLCLPALLAVVMHCLILNFSLRRDPGLDFESWDTEWRFIDLCLSSGEWNTLDRPVFIGRLGQHHMNQVYHLIKLWINS